ncbi:MAG: prephenate dehydrogenase [Flavobacteriaceae bacterium]|jgi:prephenate dehydrogenase|nr:prephenate dehydrogenase [Flavobacteriaceae bacterium]MBT6128046.1 prephenate dehydrogenase [Flavobacteriaceae bacterium]MDG1028410.1 prephenate dehydrogenase [Flavobacteriaceae bacterium]
MKIGIIGVGLIGGSLALSARQHIPDVEIYGSNRSQANLQKSLDLGLIDFRLEEAMIKQMDVILLSIPVDIALERLVDLMDEVNDNALIMDFGSTKAAICQQVALHSKRGQFLATHPIAGTEYSGPAAALPDLFEDKIQILCEAQKTRPDLLEWAQDWFKKMGMNLREMDAVEHDQHITYVSHLSHISSYMLGKTVMEKEKDQSAIFDMAGSGFSSTVRLAKSSPYMWVPIFKQNKENISETLSQYINNLNQFKQLLDASRFDELHEQILEINNIRQILEGITNTKNNK